MRRLILLLVLLAAFISCSPNDDTPRFHLELVPAVSVEMPDSFELGGVYTITVWYNRPTTCHFPDGFYYESNLNERTFAVQNIVEEKSGCTDLADELISDTFNFKVLSNGSYVFKFWTGVDSEGANTFIEREIPVY